MSLTRTPASAVSVSSVAPGRHGPTRRLRLAALLCLACAAVLFPWAAYLSTSLPQTYVLTDWNGAWVGFDVLLTSVGSDAVVAFATAVLVELPLAAYLVRHASRPITEAARPAVMAAQIVSAPDMSRGSAGRAHVLRQQRSRSRGGAHDGSVHRHGRRQHHRLRPAAPHRRAR
ncbi:MAG: hypothetical protein ACXVYY_08505 [Oryzihumus sp.]